MEGSGAQEPAIEDDMATPHGAQDRDKMAVWHLNKCGSSTKVKEDEATIMKDMRVLVLLLIAAILAVQVLETAAYRKNRHRYHRGKYRGIARSYLRWKYNHRYNNNNNDNIN
ncbi:unnamed protein product [Nippostrongylus brasiliensis]|uniref:Uncharacterized protein n=1 Tax=Nippostrongylus brasiliensis TaxID=27835 RepID=A0A0N4YGG4_NIPBR|nr:unnamed protein product [Nippostrongylus brasiliensis]